MTELFVTLLSVSLSTGFIAAALMAVAPLITRRYASKWLFLIWALLAVRLLIPFNGLPSVKEEPTYAPPAEVIAPAEPRVSYPRIEISIPKQMTEPQSLPRQEAAPAVSVKRRQFTPLEVLAAVWAAGAALCFAAQIAAFAASKHRVLKNAQAVGDEESEIFSDLCKEFGAGKNLKLVRSSGADCPMLMGYMRPILAIPADLGGREQLRYIIRHELTHYSRKDVWFKLLFAAAVSVHWFNPAVWLMRRRADIDMELAVDESVVGGFDPQVRKEYAEALFATVSSGRTAHGALSTRFSGSMKVLKKRFYNIMKKFNKKNGAVILAIVLLLTVAAGALIGCTADLNKSGDRISAKAAEELIEKEFEVRRILFTDPPEYDPEDSIGLVGSLYGHYYRVTGGSAVSEEDIAELLESVYTGEALETRQIENPFIFYGGAVYCGVEAYESTSEMTLTDVSVVGDRPYGDGTLIRATYTTEGAEHISDYNAVLTDDGWRISEILPTFHYPSGATVTLETANAAVSAMDFYGSLELANEILLFDISPEYADGAREHEDLELEVSLDDGTTYTATFAAMKSPYDTKESCMAALSEVFTEEACKKREALFEDGGRCRIIDGILYHELTEPLRYRFLFPFTEAEKVSEDEIAVKTKFVWQDDTLSDCEITLKRENGVWKIDKIVDPEALRDDQECICAFPVSMSGLVSGGVSEDLYNALLQKLREVSGEEKVYAFAASDFDRDGSYEAFGATGEAYFDGTLWYVTLDGAEEILKDGFYLTENDESSHTLDFGETSFYTIEQSYGADSFSLIFGVKDGRPYEHEFSGKVSDIRQSGVYTVEGIDNGGYDSVVDPDGTSTGHTYKTYYFYYNGGFGEYGGIEISKEEFRQLDGAAEILDEIEARSETVTNILYRGDIGITDINSCREYEDGTRENHYTTVLYDGSRASVLGVHDGIIEPAFIPEIATYPEKFDVKNAGGIEMTIRPDVDRVDVQSSALLFAQDIAIDRLGIDFCDQRYDYSVSVNSEIDGGTGLFYVTITHGGYIYKIGINPETDEAETVDHEEISRGAPGDPLEHHLHENESPEAHGYIGRYRADMTALLEVLGGSVDGTVCMTDFFEYSAQGESPAVMAYSVTIGDKSAVIDAKTGEVLATSFLIDGHTNSEAEQADKFISDMISEKAQPYEEEIDAENIKLRWPCPEHYGISSIYGERWGVFHKGIDIADGEIDGAKICAAAPGTVIYVGNECEHNYPKTESCGCGYGLGNFCIIDHGGYQTVYAHAGEITVTEGKEVKAGDALGTVGSTGYSTGAHLHFEIRPAEEMLDELIRDKAVLEDRS